MDVVAAKSFANGKVYALRTTSGVVVETTDTFLPLYTRDAIQRGSNVLDTADYGSRADRWMIGLSTLSGCPVRCKFCACNAFTDQKGWAVISSQEMIDQIDFVLNQNPGIEPDRSSEFKILLTRMGEPAMNTVAVIRALERIHDTYKNAVVSVSTVGLWSGHFLQELRVKAANWRKDFVQLQFSLHSTDEDYRRWLIPVRLLSFEELSAFGDLWFKTAKSTRKITLNFTLTAQEEGKRYGAFDPGVLRRWFDPSRYFIKLSPLNDNVASEANQLHGLIPQTNY